MFSLGHDCALLKIESERNFFGQKLYKDDTWPILSPSYNLSKSSILIDTLLRQKQLHTGLFVCKRAHGSDTHKKHTEMWEKIREKYVVCVILLKL